MLRDLVGAMGRQHLNGFTWDHINAEFVCVCGCTRGVPLFFKDHKANCPFRIADLALYGPGPEARA